MDNIKNRGLVAGVIAAAAIGMYVYKRKDHSGPSNVVKEVPSKLPNAEEVKDQVKAVGAAVEAVPAAVKDLSKKIESTSTAVEGEAKTLTQKVVSALSFGGNGKKSEEKPPEGTPNMFGKNE